MLQATHTSPLHRQRERLCVSGSIKGHSTVVHRLVSLRPTPSPAWCRLQDRSSIHTTIVVAAGAGDQPELDEDESYEDFGGAEEAYDEDEEADFAAAEFADAPLDEESLRIRQQMAAEAGPSDAAVDEADEADYEDEAPFPEPEYKSMLLTDLMGLAAEFGAAAMLEEYGDILVNGFSDNAEGVMPGDIYCCIDHVSAMDVIDAHDAYYLQEAVQNGAVAVVAEAGRQLPEFPEDIPIIYAEDVQELATRLAAVFYDKPGSSMNLIAVAGSSGKTTVSWLVRGVLEQAGQLTGMVGSIEHALAEHLMTPEGDLWEADDIDPAEGRECSSPFALVPYKGRYSLEETTPNGLRMQKLLAGMRDRGATAAVVECSASSIAGGSTEWLEPNIAVFTNLGDDPTDMEVFDSEQEYLDSMLELIRGLRDADRQRAVINADDESYRAAEAACGSVPFLTFGINADADVRAETLELTLWQTTMIVRTPVGRLEIISNLVGRHNVYNILAAVAVGVLLNIPLADIGAGIESVQVVPGRCEVVNNVLDLPPEGEGEEEQPQQQPKLPHDFPVVVDAADTPQRLATVLSTLREAGAERVFTVFGCDGQTSAGEVRARLGEVAHQRSEFVIVTNSSPRLEDPADIVQDIIAGWPNEMFEPYAAYVYNVFQDQTRCPLWFEPFLHSAQRRWKRHIMEDRFQAIRAAIGTAAPGDVVLIAGRGHKDYVEHWDGEDGLVMGWFDDRVEARNALSKLEYLYALVDIDRSSLPWGKDADEKSVVIEL